MKVVILRHFHSNRWGIFPAGTLRYERMKALGSIKAEPAERPYTLRSHTVRIRGAGVRNLGIPEVERTFLGMGEAGAFIHDHFERS